MAEAERVGTRTPKNNIQLKVEFQSADKARSLARYENKRRAFQNHSEMMQARNDMIEQDLLAKQTQKMLIKAANMDTYEKINH